MEDFSGQAIESVMTGEQAFCKFLSANDTGKTGGHQDGIYMPKPSFRILFDEPGVKGSNKDRWVRFFWQDGSQTVSRFIYYGQGTRNEYRITKFGRGFPYLRPEYTGALFIMVKMSPDEYQGFVLNTEDEIQNFLDAFALTPAETNRLIETNYPDLKTRERLEIDRVVTSTLKGNFPDSFTMSYLARHIQNEIHHNRFSVYGNPDSILLKWTETEYHLFQAIEQYQYGDKVLKGFQSVDDFVILANQVLNRRKSRAGKSLEHHLSAIFNECRIKYTAQAITEGNKKPDFLFPSEEAYHDMTFSIDNLCTLAAKTTCKDRWRQILNEADRLRDDYKYLCTMQQGISAQQMDEMQAEKVILVVPKEYISSYPKDRKDRIWTIKKFIDYVREMEGLPV